MPQAKIAIDEDGRIGVEGESVFRGYFPEVSTARRFLTEDIGEIDGRGFLRVLGRRDAVIITAGKRCSRGGGGGAAGVGRIRGRGGDRAPGSRVGRDRGGVLSGADEEPDVTRVERLVRGATRRVQAPKRYVAVAAWPRNAQGKLNRAELTAHVRDRQAAT